MPDHDYLKTVTIGAPETPKDTIVLCDYDPHWSALYAQEHVKIARALAGQSVRIEHVGSTSVPGSAPSRSSISSCTSMTPRAKSATRQRSKQLATRCACANRIGTSIACSKASRPLSISTCSVKAVTKHSACWPFATICALILTTAHVTPQKSADSPRKNGRIFRITPTPRQPSCRRSWRTFPLCRQLPYNKSQTLANHSPAFSSARKAALRRRFRRCYFALLANHTSFSYTEHSSGAQIFARS